MQNLAGRQVYLGAVGITEMTFLKALRKKEKRKRKTAAHSNRN